MIGASGAMSAVMGTYALLYSQNQVKAIGPLSAHAVRILWLAAAWMAIQFMIGIVGLGGIGRIAIGAHLGGFVPGLLLTRPLIHLRFRQSCRRFTFGAAPSQAAAVDGDAQPTILFRSHPPSAVPPRPMLSRHFHHS